MKEPSALSRLQDDELCIVTTEDGEHEVRWSLVNWCFFYLDRGTPTVFPSEEVQEWRPASIPFR